MGKRRIAIWCASFLICLPAVYVAQETLFTTTMKNAPSGTDLTQMQLADLGASMPDEQQETTAAPAPTGNPSLNPKSMLPPQVDSVEALRQQIRRLDEIMQNPAAYEAMEIIEALPYMKLYHPKDEGAFLERLVLSHPDGEVRKAAVEAVSGAGQGEVLILGSQDRSEEVRDSAVRSMFRLERDEGERVFERAVLDMLVTEKEASPLRNALTYADYYAKDGQQMLEIGARLLERSDLPAEIVSTVVETLSEYDLDYLQIFSAVQASPSFQSMTPEEQEKVAARLLTSDGP